MTTEEKVRVLQTSKKQLEEACNTIFEAGNALKLAGLQIVEESNHAFFSIRKALIDQAAKLYDKELEIRKAGLTAAKVKFEGAKNG